MEVAVEVVVIPVEDVDRALSFYQGLGWRLDADYEAGPEFRIVQVTPPGSPCSVHFGRGLTTAEPGSARAYLVASDIEAARADLIGKGADVSPVFHNVYDTGAEVRVDGRDPDGRSYATYASFTDPDANVWTLQEVGERAPGR
ncbi:glyoxalase [Streptomyces sp. PLK6-54]|uniref:Glyoxalase n=1 Tax=Actinacidiphila acidipaludis TaxID=2873382 RepID=A0ABS7Q530_9ACTN|nr:glyoxalase [Streptomyces acidipaludis]